MTALRRKVRSLTAFLALVVVTALAARLGGFLQRARLAAHENPGVEEEVNTVISSFHAMQVAEVPEYVLIDLNDGS